MSANVLVHVGVCHDRKLDRAPARVKATAGRSDVVAECKVRGIHNTAVPQIGYAHLRPSAVVAAVGGIAVTRNTRRSLSDLRRTEGSVGRRLTTAAHLEGALIDLHDAVARSTASTGAGTGHRLRLVACFARLAAFTRSPGAKLAVTGGAARIWIALAVGSTQLAVRAVVVAVAVAEAALLRKVAHVAAVVQQRVVAAGLDAASDCSPVAIGKIAGLFWAGAWAGLGLRRAVTLAGVHVGWLVGPVTQGITSFLNRVLTTIDRTKSILPLGQAVAAGFGNQGVRVAAARLVVDLNAAVAVSFILHQYTLLVAGVALRDLLWIALAGLATLDRRAGVIGAGEVVAVAACALIASFIGTACSPSPEGCHVAVAEHRACLLRRIAATTVYVAVLIVATVASTRAVGAILCATGAQLAASNRAAVCSIHGLPLVAGRHTALRDDHVAIDRATAVSDAHIGSGQRVTGPASLSAAAAQCTVLVGLASVNGNAPATRAGIAGRALGGAATLSSTNGRAYIACLQEITCSRLLSL